MPYFPTEDAWTHVSQPSRPPKSPGHPPTPSRPPHATQNHDLHQTTLVFGQPSTPPQHHTRSRSCSCSQSHSRSPQRPQSLAILDAINTINSSAPSLTQNSEKSPDRTPSPPLNNLNTSLTAQASLLNNPIAADWDIIAIQTVTSQPSNLQTTTT
ncbi:hypothetical protein DFH29DRAFT_1007802 [Suillus ampliporus]|nr:hypothetical protein DFH29DRAFT_1007802 [Suillus ampliporus]